ncbi:hypothetical protein A2707_04460 [Candidatus Saccharibacteria bacterium RIFCSPHIGHO2_01_FULL_45_15]|nr:MAG: hypothetical protein A2707_04460 [Candidatus Saccharibacteria bacterium RIFCSPHIGHO2_01_FULL_45_15]OGL32769.1 MAG: hypothetical protein A3E76_05500 [Candidatus Saccharibacteria bacterium RIFCSPHIGHO2_12_FULL_44_22]
MNEPRALEIIRNLEDEHTERKTASNSYNLKDVYRYVVALSNEGGGHLILGVKDNGAIGGTQAFGDIQKLKIDVLHQPKISRRIRIEVDVFTIESKRILIISVPPRHRGEPDSYDGAFLMRSGESLVGMNHDMIKDIIAEDTSDYSADIVEGLGNAALDAQAIEIARRLWMRKSGNENIEMMSPDEVVQGLGLKDERGITRAGLILLGKENYISRLQPNAEVVWEYRRKSSDVQYASRTDFRKAVLLYLEELWVQIDARNEVAHVSEGFLIRDIPAFTETTIRESVLNAIAHRDYQDRGSVYIRQSSEDLVVESPGGFIAGITPENIMRAASKPRNRLVAEVFQKLGLVERSGQGVDKIFVDSISFGKGQPSYESSTPHEVKLIVNAQVQDFQFIKYLDKVSRDVGISLSPSDYVILEKVRLGLIDSMGSDSGLAKLSAAGIIEKARRGRYTKPMLAKRFYSAMNKSGEYTRQRGLDVQQKKQLILTHLENFPRAYINDIDEALGFEVKRSTLNNYLKTLKDEDKIEFIGNPHVVRGDRKGHWRLKK